MSKGMHDFTTRFNGQGYEFTVFVNTNEDAREVGARLQRAARGQVKAACMVGLVNLTPEQTAQRMEALARLAVSPGAVEVDGLWRPKG